MDASPPLTASAVVDLVYTLCAASPAVQLALSPSGSALQLFARPLHGPRTWHVLNELPGGGEVVVKLFPSAASAAAELLLARVAQATPGCEDTRPPLLHEDAAAGLAVFRRLLPHGDARSEIIAGNLFPLLARAAGDAMAPVHFATSVWAQGRQGPAAAAAAQAARQPPPATLQAYDSLLAAPQASALPPAAAAALAALRARLCEGKEALLHGALDTGALLCGLIPLGQPKAVNFESMRPDEYPLGYHPTPPAIAALTAAAAAAAAAATTAPGAPPGTPSLMATSGGEAAVLASALPPPTLTGDLRVTGGGAGFLGPLGFDLGTLAASLATAALAARARARAATAEVAKGGYGRYIAQRSLERWEGSARELLQVAVGVWASWAGAFVGAWQSNLGASEAGVGGGVGVDRSEAGVAAQLARQVALSSSSSSREEGAGAGAQPEPAAAVVTREQWNAPRTALPAGGLSGTAAAFLVGVLGDCLGYAGAALLLSVSGSAGSLPAEFQALPKPKGSALCAAEAVARARALGSALLSVSDRVAGIFAAVGGGSGEGAVARLEAVVEGGLGALAAAVLAVDEHSAWQAEGGGAAAEGVVAEAAAGAAVGALEALARGEGVVLG